MTERGLPDFTAVAHPWMCDVMGHLNVRHYAAMFDDASFHLLGRIAGAVADEQRGWADVQSTTRYQREVRAGELLLIRSSVLKVGGASLSYRQVMLNALDGEVRAINETTTVYFNQIERCAARIDQAMRDRAAVLAALPIDNAG